MGKRGTVPRIKRPDYEAHNTLPFGAEVKDVWSYTPLPPMFSCRGVCLITGTTLPV